jgi:hypothetical protein
LINFYKNVKQIFDQRLGQDAWAWIAAQLPDRVFHHKLEEVLQAISSTWALAANAKAADQMERESLDDLSPDEIRTLSTELGDLITDGTAVEETRSAPHSSSKLAALTEPANEEEQAIRDFFNAANADGEKNADAAADEVQQESYDFFNAVDDITDVEKKTDATNVEEETDVKKERPARYL